MMDVPAWYWIVLAAGGVFAFVFLRPRSDFGEARYTGLLGGEAGEVEAWGVNADLAPVSHGFPVLEDARSLVRAARAAAGQHYERGEDALAATVRGFTRGGAAEDFVEIHCITPDRAQARVGAAVTGTGREQTAACDGVLALDRLVEAFFAGPERFAEYWYGLPGRTEPYRQSARPAPASRPA